MGVGITEKHKLYIRYPYKIENKLIIRNLHPNIIEVHLPRQKSRRWCIIDFENREKLIEAKTALNKIKVENKRIKVFAYKKGPVRKEKDKKNSNVVSYQEASSKNLEKLLKKTV